MSTNSFSDDCWNELVTSRTQYAMIRAKRIFIERLMFQHRGRYFGARVVFVPYLHVLHVLSYRPGINIATGSPVQLCQPSRASGGEGLKASSMCWSKRGGLSEVSFLRPRFYFSNWPDNNSELLRLTKVFVTRAP